MANFANYGALQTLKAVLNQTPAPMPPALYVKIHIGDPGPDGLLNPALNTERMEAFWGTAVNIGVDGRAEAVVSANIVWPSVPNDETYTDLSFWDALTGGNVWYYDSLTAPVAVITGGAFVLPAGQTVDHA